MSTTGTAEPNEVCAIVVTFQPDAGLAARMAVLREQVARVVLVDNGSAPEFRARVEALHGSPNMTVIFNAENCGLAAALNQGVAWAFQNGFPWIATFDQDSTVTPGFFAALFQAYEACPQRGRVGILAPVLRDAVLGTLHTFTYSRYRDHELWSVVRMSVTSGNLIPARVFADAGTYPENFFIDYIDQEFCLRCRRRGWLILEAHRAVLDHRYGQPERRRFLWKNPVVTNHSALRLYYRARNRLVVYWRHGLFDLHWLAREAGECVRDTAKMVLLEDERCAKLRALALGTWHALLGRMGPKR